jgi:FkbM family methyltransferase
VDDAGTRRILERAYFSEDPHEREVLAALPRLLAGCTLAVDAGASLGQYTKALDGILEGAEVHAVEADPDRYAWLRRNCEEWAAGSGNRLVAHHAALAAHAGDTEYFVTHSDVSGAMRPHETARPVEWERITVPAVTLDDLLGGRVPDFVKIDVEGAELAVLEGARRILAAGRTTFLIELHDWDDRGAPRAVMRLMRDAGYRMAWLHGQAVFVTSRRRWLRLKASELRRPRLVAQRAKARLSAAAGAARARRG